MREKYPIVSPRFDSSQRVTRFPEQSVKSLCTKKKEWEREREREKEKGEQEGRRVGAHTKGYVYGVKNTRGRGRSRHFGAPA